MEDLPQEEQEKLAQKLRNSGINGSGASYFNFDREEMTKKEFEDLKGDLNEMMSGFPMPAMPDAPAHWPFTSPNDQNPLTDDFDLLIATTPIPSKAMDQLKRKSLEAASKTLDAIDWSTIDRSAQEAIKQADKALLQTNSALQHVDWTAIDRQIDDAIKQVDATDWDAIVTVNGTRKNNRAYSRQLKKELAGARRAAVLAANRNRQAAGYSRTFAADRRERVEDRKRTLEERRSIVASRGAGNNAYQGIINKMEEDGLLDQARSFTIVKKGDQITINGKTQPSSVSEKYRSYFPDRDVTIAGSANRLTILEADEIETR